MVEITWKFGRRVLFILYLSRFPIIFFVNPLRKRVEMRSEWQLSRNPLQLDLEKLIFLNPKFDSQTEKQ